MDLKKVAVIGLAIGLVVNILDAAVQGGLLAGSYAAIPAFRNTTDVLPYLNPGRLRCGLRVRGGLPAPGRRI